MVNFFKHNWLTRLFCKSQSFRVTCLVVVLVIGLCLGPFLAEDKSEKASKWSMTTNVGYVISSTYDMAYDHSVIVTDVSSFTVNSICLVEIGNPVTIRVWRKDGESYLCTEKMSLCFKIIKGGKND